MLTVTICIGSSCYVRGSDKIAETFEKIIDQNDLNDEVELVGSFCMDHCSMGVSVRVGDTVYRGVDPEDAEVFFLNEVMPQVQNGNHP
jgi:NADH:ubiquinone oxidoreductase subunit E